MVNSIVNHRHLIYIRNIVIVIIAITIAGYPYLLYTGFMYEKGSVSFWGSALVVAVLLVSFSGIAYAAHREHDRRRADLTNS